MRVLLVVFLVACGDDAGATDGGTGMDSAPAPCPTPGMAEHVACGSCGVVERFCTADRAWAYGPCMELGECMPGTMGELACGNCGTQPSRCTAACMWEASGACGGEGACMPGEATRSTDGCMADESREATCSDACVYEPVGVCASDGCRMPGAMENVPCGACGTRTRTCGADNLWAYGNCLAARGCVPDTTRTVACGRCGTQLEACGADCTWGAGECTGEGECSPRSTRLNRCGPGMIQTEVCTSECAWEPTGICRAATVDGGVGDGGLGIDAACILEKCTSSADCCPGQFCSVFGRCIGD